MDVENYPMLGGDAPVPLFSVGAMSPGPFASSPMSPDSASPLGFDYGSLSPIYGREHYYGSPGYGSGYSSPDCGYSPPFSPPPPGTEFFSEVGQQEETVTAHVHPRGQGGAAEPCLSLYLRKDVRVDVSANGSLMLSNPRQGVFISLGSDGRQMAVVHPVGRVMQNKGRIEIQTQDWALKSAKMWQRGISFTTNHHALSYLVDTAGARSTTDTFRDLHSRNIAQGEELHDIVVLRCVSAYLYVQLLTFQIFLTCPPALEDTRIRLSPSSAACLN